MNRTLSLARCLLALSLAAGLGLATAQARAQSPEAQFTQLLLSGAWCSFSYNKVSGASSSSRYRFANNGTWAGGSQSETYSSGRNGTVAGQTNSGRGGRWAVQQGSFYLSEGAGPMERVEVFVKLNSNGAPIIVAAGIEYMRCN